MTGEAPNYKDTLTITRTEFPQKAKLATSEPARLEKWREMDLEGKIAEARRGAEKYVLHDGPPYANGDIHLGHALNKTLKDILVRYKTMRGYHAKYVPGFDCHGLPIEQKVLEKLGSKAWETPAAEIRKLCHDYATRFIGLQTEQFQRLGVGGAWDQPYLTLDPKYEVGILKGLRDMLARGAIYRGTKPVWWDTAFQTALAEAEIEYEEHESNSIYVRFPLLNPADCPALAEFAGPDRYWGDPAQGINVVIWTTTPWTLPANLAVCLHPDFEYGLYESGSEKLLVAKGLAEAFFAETGLPEPRLVAEIGGKALEGLRMAHPLLDKEVPLILGSHVTLETGTGCVHTAPGHGVDDWIVGQKYGLEVFMPVDGAGRYTDLYPEMQGESVWKANPRIIERLGERGLLVWAGKFRHQYPYSWRSHKPLITRATSQWFMSMDHDGIRGQCVRAIHEDVRWIPDWGRERILGMMENRPDWCLSRQRSWGVPIPVLRQAETGDSFFTVEIVDRFIELVAEHGTDCWFTLPVEDFVPESMEALGPFEKENDILDVWFDSGASHIAVLEQDPELASPADLYLEGSDQHRGWFNSSLVVSMAARDRAPYKAVLTHGFVLDGKGQAMSKSRGNVISPLKIIEQFGADILRLWVVSEDYRNDVAASMDIFKQASETYRRIRNTLRFLLGNLADFDPERHTIPVAERDELDRLLLTELHGVVRRSIRAYEDYAFHRIYHEANQFCVVSLSALYLDIVKDRLYCSAPDDALRRSCQSTVWDVFSALCRILAPILPFTSDEAWNYARPQSPGVHIEPFPEADPAWEDPARAETWRRCRELRDLINPAIEQKRREKVLGKSLDAAVTLRPLSRKLADFLQARSGFLREFCIVSQLVIDDSAAEERDFDRMAEALEIDVQPAAGEKCARCWTYSEELGTDGAHPALCPRCTDVLRRIG